MSKLDDLDEFSAFGISNIHRLDSLGYQPFLPRSKTDNNEIAWHINQVNKISPQKNKSIRENEVDIEESICSDINSILNFEDSSPDQRSTTSRSVESTKPKIKHSIFNQSGLTVVGFSNKYSLKHSQVYNLFSNFGNISMISIRKNSVRVKFRTV